MSATHSFYVVDGQRLSPLAASIATAVLSERPEAALCVMSVHADPQLSSFALVMAAFNEVFAALANSSHPSTSRDAEELAILNATTPESWKAIFAAYTGETAYTGFSAKQVLKTGETRCVFQELFAAEISGSAMEIIIAQHPLPESAITAVPQTRGAEIPYRDSTPPGDAMSSDTVAHSPTFACSQTSVKPPQRKRRASRQEDGPKELRWVIEKETSFEKRPRLAVAFTCTGCQSTQTSQRRCACIRDTGILAYTSSQAWPSRSWHTVQRLWATMEENLPRQPVLC